MIRKVRKGLEVFKIELRDLGEFAVTWNLPARRMTVKGMTPEYSALPDYVEYEIQDRVLTLKAMVKVLKLSSKEIKRLWKREVASAKKKARRKKRGEID